MNNWDLSSECEFYSQDFGDNCHNSSLCMHMHNARSLSYATPSHTGSLKEVKSFTLAASASTNIEKVQEIGTLCLLRAAFGARGCKQIDLLKAQFWSPHSFAQKPSTSPLSNKSCFCSFLSYPSLVFCTCFLTAVQNALWPPKKQPSPVSTLCLCFAYALLALKSPFPTLAFTVFMPIKKSFPFFFLIFSLHCAACWP